MKTLSTTLRDTLTCSAHQPRTCSCQWDTPPNSSGRCFNTEKHLQNRSLNNDPRTGTQKLQQNRGDIIESTRNILLRNPITLQQFVNRALNRPAQNISQRLLKAIVQCLVKRRHDRRTQRNPTEETKATLSRIRLL